MFKDCYASYDENTGFIKLGNSKIEKVLPAEIARSETRDQKFRENREGLK